MLKPLLLGTAMLFAIPALAQTAGGGTGATTNDHDPTEATDDAGVQASGTTSMGTQVNGGVTAAAPGLRSGQTAQANARAGLCSQGAAASGAGSANSGGVRGTAVSDCGTMQHEMSATAQGSAGTGSSGGTAGTASGTLSGAGTASTSGTWSGSATSGAYAGQGGPYEARSYPSCTRARTDSCTQVHERRSRR